MSFDDTIRDHTHALLTVAEAINALTNTIQRATHLAPAAITKVAPPETKPKSSRSTKKDPAFKEPLIPPLELHDPEEEKTPPADDDGDMLTQIENERTKDAMAQGAKENARAEALRKKQLEAQKLKESQEAALSNAIPDPTSALAISQDIAAKKAAGTPVTNVEAIKDTRQLMVQDIKAAAQKDIEKAYAEFSSLANSYIMSSKIARENLVKLFNDNGFNTGHDLKAAALSEGSISLIAKAKAALQKLIDADSPQGDLV